MKKGYKKWTAKELSKLEELVQAKTPIAEIATQLRRTPKSIENKLYELFEAPYKGKQRKLSPSEIAELENISTSEAAEKFGKSNVAIRIKKSREKITKDNLTERIMFRATPEQANILKKRGGGKWIRARLEEEIKRIE